MKSSVNNLLKMSFTLRNSITFRRHLNVLNIQAYLCHSSSKDSDINVIKNDLDNPSAIFDYIRKHQESITVQKCLEALRELSKYYKGSSNRCRVKIEKKDLLELCYEIDKRNDSLTTCEAIEAIKLLSNLGVSKKTLIFQTLLKRIRDNFHLLTSDDSDELQQILKRMEKSKLTDAMKMALSLVSKVHVKDKSLDIYSLCDNLYNAFKERNLDKTKMDSIIESISKYEKKIPALCAKSIFTSLTKIPKHLLSQYRDIITKIQDIILDQASELQFRDVNDILFAYIVSREKNQFVEEFYNEKLVDDLINSLLSRKKVSLSAGISIMRTLKILGHFHKSLLDYIANECYENPRLILKMDSKTLSTFMYSLASFAYKPLFWESIRQLIAENKNLESSRDSFLINLVSSLATLDYYPDNLISMVFESKELQNRTMKLNVQYNFCLLYQLVSIFHPDFSTNRISNSVPCFLMDFLKYEVSQSNTFPLLPDLVKAFGGTEYIKNSVGTKLGHYIDHIIVMREGRFPIAINQDNIRAKDDVDTITFIEDIVMPSNSQIIAILCLSEGSYLRNVKQLRGHVQAKIRSLEALKYNVIPIYLPEWMNLNNRDRIPYIMNYIKLKCPSDNMSINI